MLLTGIDGLVYIVGAATSIYTIDRLGRRKLMYGGLIGQALFLAVVGACQYLVGVGYTKAAPAVVVFIMAYNFTFGATWLSLAWLYPSEIFSTALRAKGNSMSTAANWLGNFIVAEIAPVMFDSIGYWTFLIFSFLNLVYLIPVFFYFPETKGKSLEDIELIFACKEFQDDVLSMRSQAASCRSGATSGDRVSIRYGGDDKKMGINFKDYYVEEEKLDGPNFKDFD